MRERGTEQGGVQMVGQFLSLVLAWLALRGDLRPCACVLVFLDDACADGMRTVQIREVRSNYSTSGRWSILRKWLFVAMG
jgi:hypothetical protein